MSEGNTTPRVATTPPILPEHLAPRKGRGVHRDDARGTLTDSEPVPPAPPPSPSPYSPRPRAAKWAACVAAAEGHHADLGEGSKTSSPESLCHSVSFFIPHSRIDRARRPPRADGLDRSVRAAHDKAKRIVHVQRRDLLLNILPQKLHLASGASGSRGGRP